MERALVAVAPHVHLQALQLDAELVADHVDREVREVGLAGQRAVAGELGDLELDHVVAARRTGWRRRAVPCSAPSAGWAACRARRRRGGLGGDVGPASVRCGGLLGRSRRGVERVLFGMVAGGGREGRDAIIRACSESAALGREQVFKSTVRHQATSGRRHGLLSTCRRLMRLNSIKLSGFKSFADPTTFQLPGQRVGVVGPNGCGKSNIMDAVRWVLGESKASELRGESMQDVIFNGSGSRKPAEPRQRRAGVQQRVGARRRPVEPVRRDRRQARADARRHVSSYYINNQPVRRRDVQDVFLGTGLGPARLRHHRPGHDLAHHREQARGAAPVPRGGRRRLEVQGAPPRDREPAEGHAREPDRASTTSCAS